MEWRKEIDTCNEVIRSGGIVAYPTDTVWGIGCDATNAEAVKKIGEIKQRVDKSYLVLMTDEGMLQRYVKYVPEVAWDLIDAAEEPLTIIYPEGYNLAAGVCASDGTVGVRLTEDPFCQALIRKVRKPLISTSANLSGKPTPCYFDEIEPEVLNLLDYVVQYKREDRTPMKPSSIIKLGLTGQVQIIRS